MEATDRRGFLTSSTRRFADEDRPLPIGHLQTNSQPRTVTDMLDLLDVPEGARVLDVGSGSGWTTALLAHLVGPAGQVIGTEIVPDLTAFGAGNLAATHRPWARIEQAHPDRLGWPESAPYDRILVSAGATTLPVSLIGQLADGGVLVVPVGRAMTRVIRRGDRHDVEQHGSYIFVPLIEPPPAPTTPRPTTPGPTSPGPATG